MKQKCNMKKCSRFSEAITASSRTLFSFAIAAVLLPAVCLPMNAHAQDSKLAIPVYQDADGDGLNDRFRDANGDGVNDVTGTAYPHNFPFADVDGDGVNDIFRDANGDGVNDYLLEGGGADFPLLDFDGDGVNDVPGAAAASPVRQRFVDENGDGIDDRVARERLRKLRIRSFVDRDGDGIDDREAMGPVRRMFERFFSEDEGYVSDVIDDDGIDQSFEREDPSSDEFIDSNDDGIQDGRNLNQRLPESIDP